MCSPHETARVSDPDFDCAEVFANPQISSPPPRLPKNEIFGRSLVRAFADKRQHRIFRGAVFSWLLKRWRRQ
jgi:hypothetical protein